jgi:hypothetical protein
MFVVLFDSLPLANGLAQENSRMLLIREAIASDVPLIVDMIRELAEFERELDKVEITPEDLIRDGFGGKPRFHALLAEWNNQPAEYSVYFFTIRRGVVRQNFNPFLKQQLNPGLNERVFC